MHGCGDELIILMKEHTDKEIILVGDCFDRAKRGVLVWQTIKKYNLRVTLGNHEKKIIDYFEGRKDWLPAHYIWFLNSMATFNEDFLIFYQWLKSLPLIIELPDCIVAHGGACLDNPRRPDVSMNVYGGYSPEKKMPGYRNTVRDWWNQYATTEHNTRVVYGHITQKEPMVTRNSLGIDTGACMGGKLTGYCPEDGTFTSVKAKEHYFSKIKGHKFEPCPKVLHFREKIIRECV